MSPQQNERLLHEEARVHQHADADEEETHEELVEGLHDAGRMIGLVRTADDETGEERTQGERKPQ